jgi:Protein of unknown function (DUF2637)
MHRSEPRPRMTQREIKFIVDKFAGIARVLVDADPDDKADIFRQLGLTPTYRPGRQPTKAQLEAPQHRYLESVRGARATNWAWWRNCSDQVFCRWRCPVTAADRVIRWTTAVAVIGVASVASVASYEHAYDLVRAHGEAGWTARLVPLTVDGLIYASSMVMLDCARRKVPVPALARWLLELGDHGGAGGECRSRSRARRDGCGGGRVVGGRAGRLVRAAHDDHPICPAARSWRGPGRGA